MYQVEILVLIQSLIASLFICSPILFIGRHVYRKVVPGSWLVENWTDSVVRSLALVLFVSMICSAIYLVMEKPDWYALIAPIEFVLGFFFFPLYKKMD